MERECLKCGGVNVTATGSAAEACPTCGAIYAKVALARARQRMDAERSPVHVKRFPTGWVLGAAAVVAAVALGLPAYQKHAAKMQLEAQRAEQKAKMLQAMHEFDALDRQRGDWDTQLRIASSTPRMMLADPVKDLAETAKQTRALKFSTPCVARSRDMLADAMDARVDAFLMFMQQRQIDADVARDKSDEAMSEFELYGVKCMRSIRLPNGPEPG